MNCYIVLLRCTLDDIPVRVFSDKQDALDFASEYPVEPGEYLGDVFGIDISGEMAVTVLTMENGKPTKLETYKEIRKMSTTENVIVGKVSCAIADAVNATIDGGYTAEDFLKCAAECWKEQKIEEAAADYHRIWCKK